jgi:hypothetical protein
MLKKCFSIESIRCLEVWVFTCKQIWSLWIRANKFVALTPRIRLALEIKIKKKLNPEKKIKIFFLKFANIYRLKHIVPETSSSSSLKFQKIFQVKIFEEN